MNQQTFLKVSGIIFGAVALFHVLRLVLGWDVVIGPYTIPVWISGVGFVVATFLSYTGCKLGKLI